MKILHIAECAGGVDRYLEMLLPKLESEFYQIFVCSQNYDVHKYLGIVDEVEQIWMLQSFSPMRIIK